jgi:hypothetical protein
MNFLKQLLAVVLGVIIGAVIVRPDLVKAQDAKEPSHHEQGRITVTAISPKVLVTLYSNERFLGFSCTQDQCYVATMD